MPRISGVNIPEHKHLDIGLTAVFGIGRVKAIKICALAKVSPDIKVKDVPEEKIELIRNLIEKNHKVEGDLRMEISQNIKRLKEIKSYRGRRHERNLPVRGQRTKTNARTKRGKKVTVGSGRKKGMEKT